MGFKQWLREWEGFNFTQERDIVNGPEYPNSRYKGKGEKTGKPRKIMKMFGVTPEDLKIQNKNWLKNRSYA